MTKAQTISGFVDVYLSPYASVGIADLSAATPLPELTFWPHDGIPSDGYTKVGSASVVVTLDSREETTRNAVSALRAMQREVRADAEAKANRLESQIQSLLAITNEA